MFKQVLTSTILALTCLTASFATTPPNVILITIDDLNDWIDPYVTDAPGSWVSGGHPQTKTPEIEAFCKGDATTPGAIVFRNAVCAAPVCGPSRSAFLSGYLPSTSGIYNNGGNMLDSVIIQNNPTLPEYFSLNGYFTTSTGKVFHGHETSNGEDFGHWAFDHHDWLSLFDNPNTATETVSRENRFNGVVDATANYADYASTINNFAWGVSNNPAFSGQKDYQKAEWAIDRLDGTEPLTEPFFMAVGIYKPHIPWFVAQEFIDLYDEFDSAPGAGDLANLDTPPIDSTDLDDIDKYNGSPPDNPPLDQSQGNNQFSAKKDHLWVEANAAEHNTVKEATRHYLACVSQSDAVLGKIINALDLSAYKDNTIVVVMGDHGWHLGEKLQWSKTFLWAESVLTPMMIRTPTTPDSATYQYCDNPVNLIDVYPTLASLCGLPAKPDLDGTDFSAMLSSPSTDTGSHAVTVSNLGVSVLSKDWHYIENRTKNTLVKITSRELYDRSMDNGRELTNLLHDDYYGALTPAEQAVIQARVDIMDDFVPASFATLIDNNNGSAPVNNLKDVTIKPARLAGMDTDGDGFSNLEEEFMGTNGTIHASEDSSHTALYPQFSKKSNGKMAFHYGVSPNPPSSMVFTHNVETRSDLDSGSWASETEVPSTEFTDSYEVEFDQTQPANAKRFGRLTVNATDTP